jgi:hypothetical protein
MIGRAQEAGKKNLSQKKNAHRPGNTRCYAALLPHSVSVEKDAGDVNFHTASFYTTRWKRNYSRQAGTLRLIKKLYLLLFYEINPHDTNTPYIKKDYLL